MSQTPSEPPPAPEHVPAEGAPLLPPWIPILIGVVLLSLAGLAIVTGLHYRDGSTMTPLVRPHGKPRPRTEVSSPPGEPQPGASLVYPGDADNVPQANEAVTGSSRAQITNTGSTINTTVRIWARRGMLTHITPASAVIYVNNLAVGEANQFATMDEVYDFPAPGSYTVRIVAPGYKDREFIVTAAENAKDEIARVEANLEHAPLH